MHKPAKMLSMLLQQMLLALVLTLNGPFVNSPTQLITALPITSKPIESTVENLAWQAWIMLPPQQQNLEKSRKVTPKSIFILPNRVKLPATTSTNGNDGGQFLNGEMGSGYAPIDCPPGQRQFESRCIPTVDIDREQLLIQELQILFQQGGVGGGAGNQGAPEYDYDYDDENIPMVENGNFEPPSLMINGGEPPILIGNNYDDADRLPVEDAPLKFNIFREKFPTDGAIAAENSNETVDGFDPMAIVENGTVPEGWQAVNITDLWTDLAIKMQMKNADEAAGSFFPETMDRSAEIAKEEVTQSSTTTTTETTSIASETNRKSNSTQGFALSDIDAIMLPAATTTQSHQHHHHHHQQQQHSNKPPQFSIFKDDSAMQLFATDHEHENDRRPSTIAQQQQQQQKTTEIMELLKIDALLPLHNVESTGTTVTRSTVTPLPYLSSGANTVRKDTLDAITTTAFPTPMAEMLKEAKSHASQEQEKDEHTRSVTMRVTLYDDDLTTTDEIESDPLTTTTTVTGGDTTTTTKDELSTFTYPSSDDATALQFHETIAEDPIQQEIIAITEQQDPANQLNDLSAAAHEVRKKSKVEPVGVELFDAADDVNDDDDDDDEQTTPLPTPPEYDMLMPAEVGSKNTLTNADAAIDLNRFTAENTVTVVGAVAAPLKNEVPSVESKIITTTTTTTTTTPAVDTTTTTIRTSEIDIATELRIINELVKGKRQGIAKSATTTIPTTTTAFMESTTTTTKSNTASIKNINNNDDNLKQETTAAAATSAKTLPTTIKNDIETTTTTTWLLNAKSGTTTTTTTPNHKSSVESGNIVTDIKDELNLVTNVLPTTITTESTATIWSKILPFLNFGSTTTTTTTTTPTTADAALNGNTNQNTYGNANENRSSLSTNRRNSKIIRINNLSTMNSLSEVKSNKIATTTTTMHTVSPTVATTTALPPAAETTTEITSESSSSSPTFWWLPIGWSLERTADIAEPPVVTPFRTQIKNAVTPVASAAQPQSLLLRFWNAFPGNQKRS